MRRTVIVVIATLLFIPVVSVVFAQEAAPEATSEPPVYALEWPLQMPDAEQLAEARACDIEAVAAERYPTEIEIEKLADSYEPKSACDFAILALAYAQRGGDNGPSEEGKVAYAKAIESNPATAFLLPMLVNYFNVVDLVEPPDFATNSITEVMIEYSYSGIAGTNVHYIVTISDANTKPTVTGELTVSGEGSEGDTKPVAGTVDVDLVQALGPAMANLVPMQSQFAEVVCFDNSLIGR